MIRLYSIGLLVSFLLCYLEWGDQRYFVGEIQYELIAKSEAASFGHFMIIIPALGELLLLYSLFKPNKKIILAGLIMLAVLALFILLAGALSMRWKMIGSALPFVVVAVLFIYNYKKL